MVIASHFSHWFEIVEGREIRKWQHQFGIFRTMKIEWLEQLSSQPASPLLRTPQPLYGRTL